MTLQELRSSLALRLGLDTVAADGMVALADTRLLNQAARFVGNEARVPRKSVILTEANLQNGITLPPDFVDVIRISAADQEAVPIVPSETYVATSTPYRKVESARFGGFFVYAPEETVKLQYVTGPGNRYPEEVKLVYMAQWPDMSAQTNVPWLNQNIRFHEIIAARAAVAALLLLDPGEEETRFRLNYNQNEYQRILEELREFVESPIPISGMPYAAMIRRRTSWR